MTRLGNCIAMMLMYCSLWSQQSKTQHDSIQPDKVSKFEFNLDIANRYIWRGQSWGGDDVVVQPAINYHVTDKLTAGFWATTNFQNEYFFPDGMDGKGYQEIDFSLSYQFSSFLTFQVSDYYWPSVERVAGIDNGFFNYGADGVKTVDASLLFDFSDREVPLYLTLSTLVAGNDYRYDGAGENPKQNYTTYLEAVYSLEELFAKITFEGTAGAVLNNQAEYYTAGDYDKASLINLGVKAVREFELTEHLVMPLSLNYIHNAAKANTDYFGRNFLVAGITFNYE